MILMMLLESAGLLPQMLGLDMLGLKLLAGAVKNTNATYRLIILSQNLATIREPFPATITAGLTLKLLMIVFEILTEGESCL
jgi:hypothetical protein